MITSMKEILLLLRPDYVHQFRDKPKLDELLGCQPHKGPSISKRVAAGDLVSPQKPKLPQSTFTSIRETLVTTLPAPHDNDGTPAPPPILQDLPPGSPSPPSGQFLPTALVHESQPPPLNESQQDQTLCFPVVFLACDILDGTSRYILAHRGKHSKFWELFHQIFRHNCSKTTEANLLKMYDKAYTQFFTLDYDRQIAITWNELIKSCDYVTFSSQPPFPHQQG